MARNPRSLIREGYFSEEGDDMDLDVPEGLGDEDMDMDMDEEPGLEDDGFDLGLDDEGPMEEENLGEVDLTALRRVLDEVEAGDKTADEAYDECCGEDSGADMLSGDDLDLGEDDLGGELGDDMGMDDMDFDLEDDDGMGMDDELMPESRGVRMECESIDRIANMLTEDPDIFN